MQRKSKKQRLRRQKKKEDIYDDDDEELYEITVDDEDALSSSNEKSKILEPSSSQKIQKTKTKLEKNKPSNDKKSKKSKDSIGEDETDSEEERWLNAVESGKLEEVDDELKRMKNPRLMTARQRAMLEKRFDLSDEMPNIPPEPLLALPSGFKEKVMTEEMLAKRAIKCQRRREQAQEKREEDKKKTVDRLLKKQDTKNSRWSRLKHIKKNLPVYTYINSQNIITVSVPEGFLFPLQANQMKDIPKPTVCGVKGCTNLKKYNCSKTGIPLCSLECYKKNLQLKC